MTARKFTSQVHRYSLPDSVVNFLNAAGAFFLKYNQDPVFCQSCRVEVPDRKALCVPCQKSKELKEMRQRIYERITPQVKTVGGTIYRP